MTINELLSLTKIIRERINDLQELKKQVSIRERFYSPTEKVVEPRYDVVAVDKKIQELRLFLFRADALVKAANARTEISIDVNIEKLLEPLPEAGTR